LTQRSWIDKISNPLQLGGIETSVLDNGIGKGTRIAWINTGSGLRYKIVLDRAMDIADAFFNQHSLAWISQTGVTPPGTFSNKGTDWLKTFGGGLMVTCGLDHTGAPEADEYGERGLHGPVSNIAAEIVSIIQPDTAANEPEMSITGVIKQFNIFGPNLELKRTISGTLGSSSIRIHDEVTNRGNTTAPHMLLYHCNFGWPLADEGATIVWQGDWQSRVAKENRFIFVEGKDFHRCPAPLAMHSGSGEEVAFIDIRADEKGKCTCGLYNSALELAFTIKFFKHQLPWLTNWQHWGKGEYTTGIEPGTNPPIGQAKARELKTLIQLEPGQARSYDLEFEVLNDKERINKFLKSANGSLDNH